MVVGLITEMCIRDSTYTALLKKLANMGYTGVEAANYNNGKFYDRTPQQFKKDVESAGDVYKRQRYYRYKRSCAYDA